ncbi:hypothetical protein SESBI_11554 [Sesbania bispinosa]|nr:hypothetical protein SESBI_11554 [Sesbania bispinosa]
MASKIRADSSYLVLLFLLSNIVIVNSAFFTIQKEAKVGDSSGKHVVHNIPSSRFQALPKGQTIPVSGPSDRHNDLKGSDYTLFSKAQEWMKTLNNVHEEARARAPTPAGTVASYSWVSRVLPKGDQIAPSGTWKCRNKFVDYWLPGRKLKFMFPYS